MTPLLLLLTPVASPMVLAGWHIQQCSTVGHGLPAVGDESVGTAAGIPPLCAALLAAATLADRRPLAVCSGALPSDFRLDPLPATPQAWLTGVDGGILYFPQTEGFRRCAMKAIRDHNPALGSVTLSAAWQAALLSEVTALY